MDSSTYRHLLGQLSKNSGIGHHNFPSHNLLSLETVQEVSEDLNGVAFGSDAEFLGSIPCYQSFPYALQRSLVLFCGSGITDHSTDLVNKKMSWERKLKGLRVSNIKAAVNSLKLMRQNKEVKLAHDLRRYVEHFHNDPEPMFSGSYNWLYTGGCLSYDEEIDGTTLVTGDFLTEQPGFNLIKLNGNLSEIQYKSSLHLKGCSPVYQIISKPQKQNSLICVRQKNYVSLYSSKKESCDSHPVKLWRKKVLGSKLLTCVDIKDNSKEIIVTDSNHDVHVFHVDTKDKIYCQSGRKIAKDFNRDSWSQVAFGDLGIYWAFRNCFTILDVREFCSEPKLEYTPTSATSQCEEICSFVKSSCDSNSMYLGTTHNILQVDLRMGKPIQRWTHLMKNPPQFMSCIKAEDKKEVLLLQSQMVDEISAIVNECGTNEGSFISKSLPCLLHCIKASLNVARLNGFCLSPSVAKRINFAVTGMLCLKNSENDITLFTTNSGGDIFQARIKKKTSERFLADEEDEKLVVDSMKMYEAECEKLSSGNSSYSHLQFTDMSHLLDGLKSNTKPRKPTKREVYWKYQEMYSPNSVKYFKDVLAQKILKVWGHSFEEPHCTPLSADSKVREWMEKFNDE